MESWQKQLKLEAIKSYMRGEIALMVGEIISEYITTDKINPLIINKSVDRIMGSINRWENPYEEIYDNENRDKDMEEELKNKLNPGKQ